jgi:anti-sigma B factor antagonist
MRWLLSTRDVNGVTIVDVKGSSIYLGETYRDLKEAVTELLEEGKRNILLNIANVRIMDSTGIGDIVGSSAKVNQYSGKLKLLNPQPRVYELFDLTKLVSVFEIFYDEREAIESFQRTSKAGSMTRG